MPFAFHDLFMSDSSSASGFLSITVEQARTVLSGRRRPCSHSWSERGQPGMQIFLFAARREPALLEKPQGRGARLALPTTFPLSLELTCRIQGQNGNP